MIEKIMNKKHIYHLSRVHKNDVLNYTKNLQIIMRKGTKIGEDKGKSIGIMVSKHDYPNSTSQVFK